jgi:archaellum component FlaC
MSKNPPSKDGTLEALDFILNVIRDHDKDLEKLATELASFAKLLGERSELKSNLERIEDQIDSLQKDVDKLSKSLSTRRNKSS